MLKNLVHLTLLTVIWKKYRSMILSTLVLFGYFFLVSLLHDDYLSYSELNQNQQHLGLSFIIKWSAFIVGILIYLSFNFGFLWKKREQTKSPDPLVKSGKKKSPSETGNETPATASNDPFAEIRNRDKLRSRADFLIEKQSPDDRP
jgi:hypothetical protein